MVFGRAALGLLIGFALAFAFHFGVLKGFGASTGFALTFGLIVGLIGGAYAAIAFSFTIYEVGALSIVGLISDLTWSMLNTIAGFAVWIPACLIVGGTFQNDDNTRRSGTFAYDKNPRDPNGSTYGATTIGTVIGGGWSSHEETHVWQARIFGPAYMVVYILSLVMNILFRLITGKTSDLVTQAYYRICFEDWAYLGGSTGGGSIRWGGWVGGLFLCLLYVSLAVLITAGAAIHSIVLSLIATAGLLIYSLIRALTPDANSGA